MMMKTILKLVLCLGVYFIGSGLVIPNCPPDASEIILFANPEDCSTYWACDNGVAVLMECAKGLFFNAKILSCDWPENADCKSSLFRGVVEYPCKCSNGNDSGIIYKCEFSFLWWEETPCEKNSPCMKNTSESC